ncbi:MAG: TIGR03617 family F420-dependent LLM class oxidoreductase [Anaerolineales bacterium]|nr:TIGR03617 family F420-dependent LLM class oxidoreductase [Anaerolineales bacterium]
MKFDVTLLSFDLGDIPAYARAAEALGFAGFWLAETQSDPFLGLALAAEHTQTIDLGTAIAVAFARSPTVTAMMAWNIGRLANGRFHLGLGSQVKAHNVLRYGVKWEKPIKKMRETTEAIRAVWHCWQTGAPLDYMGEFFKLQLMTPFFNPGPIAQPNIPIYISAVNEQMLRLAGETADGVMLHALHSVPYIEEYALPHIKDGLARRGLGRDDFQMVTAVFAIPTDDPEYAAWAKAHAQQQISFYLSTPAYRVLADLHGWHDTAAQLSQMARTGQWHAMPALITDEILDVIAVQGTWAELPGIIAGKYGRLLDRVSYYLPFIPGQNDAGWQASIRAFHRLAA